MKVAGFQIVVAVIVVVIITLDVFAESPSTNDSHSREHSYSRSQYFLKQTVYQCPVCRRLMLSLNWLINHIARHRPKSSVESPSRCHHRCTVCGKVFFNAAVLASHLHVVHHGQLCSFGFALIHLQYVCCICIHVVIGPSDLCCYTPATLGCIAMVSG